MIVLHDFRCLYFFLRFIIYKPLTHRLNLLCVVSDTSRESQIQVSYLTLLLFDLSVVFS